MRNSTDREYNYFFDWWINESYLENGEILEYTVHHVLLGQVLQLEDEVDHVLAHRGPVQLVQKSPAFKPVE